MAPVQKIKHETKQNKQSHAVWIIYGAQEIYVKFFWRTAVEGVIGRIFVFFVGSGL